MRKRSVAVALLTMVASVAGQWIVPGDEGAVLPQWRLSRAEAGIFDKIFPGNHGENDVLGNVGREIQDKAKGSIQDAINKALAINVDGLHSHRSDMIEHIRLAGASISAAIYKVGLASDITDENLLAYYGGQANNMQDNHDNLGDSYDLAAHDFPGGEMKKRLDELAMSPETKEAKANRDQQLSWSKSDRVRAVVYEGLAMRDATFIAKESMKGLKNINKLNSIEEVQQYAADLEAGLKELAQLSDDVKKLCGDINKKNKELNAVTKEYDKKNNIKEPNKKEIEAQIKQMEMK